ncbi:endonuclease/exonuclease/phosphatase family protein [Schleiferilactobacillus shenzhenensis]|uniref:Endonuclease/exonuclease/phosphatase domain-containing protein n=1 Tax=Schleiferilactobacillus shenzhenensis LY-73 TaxID=1231336 RepID=U4TQM0_9LACO|nr:endonuclease/exonuclease/phosphatase family protein [Schleiferilactobacillus shenzhenensis]ERL65740.1 hypothetical protein L248_2426 [Schleiferilactobacillus shenzhenensis LY-73]
MITITTYNIRLDTTADAPWAWAARRPYVLANLQRLDPDIFTVEEAEPHQFADLAAALPAYRGFGIPRENTVDKGEAAALFFKKTKFDALAEGHQWVSETPDEPSVYPGAATYRIFQWARLREKASGRQFYLVTVHLDHISVAARDFGVKQILTTFAQERQTLPFIVTGDFNMVPSDTAYATMTQTLRDAALTAEKRPDPTPGTWQDSEPPTYRPGQTATRLDYFFVNDQVPVAAYAVDTTVSPAGQYASDHFPVTIAVDW